MSNKESLENVRWGKDFIFMDKNCLEKPADVDVTNVLQNLFYFIAQRNVASEIITKRLRQAITRTLHAASLRVISTKSSIISRKARMVLSVCIVKFSFCSATWFIGQTSGRLTKRTKDHHPSWFEQSVAK